MEDIIKVNILGVHWDLLVLTAVVFTIFIGTHLLKKIKKLKKWHPVFLSWIVAVFVFVPTGIFKPKVVTFWGIVQYVFLTLILNGCYKGSTVLWDVLAAKFPGIKPRKK